MAQRGLRLLGEDSGKPFSWRSEIMDSDVRTRARVAEHWHASERGDIEAEHAIYAADAILDYPQSGERFRGRANIQAQRGGHPAKRHFTIRRISGIGDLWVSECTITYDGVPSFSVSIMEFTEDYVTHETQYFGDKFEAAAWRAPLAEPIPADDGEADQPARG
jgi:SnoaL-like domain